MKQVKNFHILKYYIKERFKLMIMYILISVVFMIIASIYGYDNSVANMMYGLILSLVFGLLIAVGDYIGYHNKYKELLNASSKQGEYTYYMPETRKLQELLYQELISTMEKEQRVLLSEFDEKKQDMDAYYTMWTHQVKTPIAAMKLLLQREQGGIYKQATEELFKIEQYAEMALCYARLDSMSSDLLLHSYDIYAIVKRALKKYSVLFIGSGLTFSLKEFALNAVTDEKWLLYVIEQLLSNAIKYTPKGGICIYGSDREGNACNENSDYFVIEDTGIGIRENDLPRIFERGFTGYNGRMDKKSTGIGLYLCRQIMNKLSHPIQVVSVRGKGTKVILGFKQDSILVNSNMEIQCD